MSRTSDKKLFLLAAILATGIFAALWSGSQLLSANAQVTNSNQTNSESSHPITSIDDVDCTKIVSSVHCVEGSAMVATSHDWIAGSTVSTSGTATTRVEPDKFTVTIGVETNGTTAEEAASINANMTAKVIAALRDLGISEDDISTSSYTVYPVYGVVEPLTMCIDIYPQPPECQAGQEITGYKASNSVSITLDADGNVAAGQVIDTAIEAGANTVQGAYFFVSQERQQEIQDGLISEAIDDARHRADIAAEAVGMEVSGVKSISLNDVYFPIFAKEGSLAAGDTQILPGQQEVTMTVNVVYAMSGAGGATTNGGEDTSSGEDAVAIARQFVLSKLPSLGIQIDNELDLHSDMVVQVSDTESHVEFSVMDTNGQSHDGHIEVVDGEVTVAILDGESIL